MVSLFLNIFSFIINYIYFFSQRERYTLRVEASDKGIPPLKASVKVVFDVVDRRNNPPVWNQAVYGPVRVPENITAGQKILDVSAR